MKSTDQALEDALTLHKAGRTKDAEVAYRAILASDPRHASALHLLGVLSLQGNRPAEAIALIEQAIAIQPERAPYYGNLGNALRALKRYEEAIQAYRRALELDPKFVDAHVNLGATLRSAGALEDARAVLERARALAPHHAHLLNNLANVVDAQGEPDKALELYKAALDVDPGYGEAALNLGRGYFRRFQYADATTALRLAVDRMPQCAEAQALLGSALTELNAFDEALAWLEKASALEPENAEVMTHLGLVLHKLKRDEAAERVLRAAAGLAPSFGAPLAHLGVMRLEQTRYEEAIESFREALRRDPKASTAHNGLGVCYTVLGRYLQATAEFEAEIAISPNDPDPHMNLGLVRLLLGRLDEAWPEYEHRTRRRSFNAASGPRWDGRPLGQATLLVYPEQGAGDNIQFIRYLTLLRERHPHAHVVHPVQPALRRLFSPFLSSLGVEMAPYGGEVETHGWQVPLLSLPGLFRTTLETIPAPVPYLHADPALVARWQERLAGLSGPRIGLVWAGNPEYRMDRDRSLPAELVRELLSVQGVNFVSLQKSEGREGESVVRAAGRLQDWMSEIGDFADTAALVSALDLVISVDTSVAHLAGALGKPVWLANRFSSDWRWMLDREDSPWYPTMRIFRQPARGDWASVVQRMRDALVALRDRDY